VKQLLLIGAGHAHAVVLRSLAATPLYGARITLVSPRPVQLYSGMVPGVIAGLYRRAQAEVDFRGLAARGYVDFVEGAVREFDAQRRRVVLEDGRELSYDLASLNAGSRVDASVPGSEHALPARPFESLVEGIGSAHRIAIAGGGAGGVELAMALSHRGAALTVYADRQSFAPELAKRLRTALRRAKVDFRLGMPIDAIEPGVVVRSGSTVQEFDLVLLATGARALPWLASGGLAVDAAGFVRVSDTLQSLSHPEVFAAGDCAALEGTEEPKSGVYAVRHGTILYRNLAAAVAGSDCLSYRPDPRSLALISCGGRYAIASRGRWSAAGRWVWLWKDWIDRRWVASLRAPPR
jgi:selenide, water dikinase